MAKLFTNIRAVLFGLSEDLAVELLSPLRSLTTVDSAQHTDRVSEVLKSPADIIFCRNNVDIVSSLRTARPDAPIVVVSRHPEVGDWLDSIEAGADDYCAAPFEKSQLEWILQTTVKPAPVAV